MDGGRWLVARAISASLLYTGLLFATPAGALDYTVTFNDLEDGALATGLSQSSTLLATADAEDTSPPPAVLLQRARTDADRFRTVMQSVGYYAGQVVVTVDGQAIDDPATLPAVRALPEDAEVEIAITVDPGPLYRIAVIDLVDARDGAPLPADMIDTEQLGLAPGDPAQAAAILRAEGRLVTQFQERGFPFAGVPVRQAMVDHDTRTMEIAFALETGPAATLGPVSFAGLADVEEDFLQRRVPFSPGDSYDPDSLTALRNDLSSLGVFSAVRVQTPDAVSADGTLPVTARVEERPARFFGFGLDFATSEGGGVEAFWGHRNLFGRAERLRLDGRVGRLGGQSFDRFDQIYTAEFRKPDFLALNQDLTTSAALILERPVAFDRDAFESSVGIDWRLNDILTVTGGVAVEVSNVTDEDGEDLFSFVSLPLGLRLDTTDNLLDPTEGFRLSVEATPFISILEAELPFQRIDLTGSAYVDPGTDGLLVLAARGRLGVLFGRETDDVPANLRFFSGGGGSIRGFAFQRAGPLDEDDDPFGGRSVIEGGLEARLRWDDFGIVPFIEAGGVFDDSFPTFDEDIFYGAGLGLRYFSGIGPVRFDVAVPLNPRGSDDSFQIYLSLGQAF